MSEKFSDPLFRITSYNVCYTKLLRASVTIMSKFGIETEQVATYKNSFHGVAGVITSYSIHYTKLYECILWSMISTHTRYGVRVGLSRKRREKTKNFLTPPGGVVSARIKQPPLHGWLDPPLNSPEGNGRGPPTYPAEVLSRRFFPGKSGAALAAGAP